MNIRIKEFFPPKRLCEAYPYGARWYQRLVWKAIEWIKLGLNLLCWAGISGSVGYLIFISGWYARPLEVKAIDRVASEEIPAVLQRIAKCESGSQHFDPKTGQVRTEPNKNGTVDIGYYQINETYWGKKAKELGLDLTREEDNKKMGQWIYENEGTGPWSASAKCWQ